MTAAVALARPRLLVLVLLLPIVGFGWAHWDRALTLRGADGLLVVLLAWAALQVGTMWLNAALDRDEGAVLLGRPVPPPPWIGRAGLVALGAAVGTATAAGLQVAVATALAAGASVAYSHPRLAWKGRPVLGPVVNVVGYGLLSPFVGWSVVGTAPDARTLAVWVGGAVAVLGCVYVAQAFQQDEDRARGYRTRVVTHGPAATIDAARACYAAAFAVLLGLAAVGWLPRLLLLGAPLAVGLDRHLRRWKAGPVGLDGAVRAGRLLLRATAVIVGLAGGDYLVTSVKGGPVAGLATASGWPTDVSRTPRWLERRAAPRGSAG